jgi:hypothetical protein
MSKTTIDTADLRKQLVRACGSIEMELGSIKRYLLTGTEFHDVRMAGWELGYVVEHAQTLVGWWAVLAAREGASWAQIGECLGISKQAAQQRFGQLVEDRQLPLTFAGAVPTPRSARAPVESRRKRSA